MSIHIREYGEYDAFVRDWFVDTLDEWDVPLADARTQELIDEQEPRLRWQLLGELGPDEVLVTLPKWLAEEKIGYVDGRTPTEFVGRIERETEKAIRLADATAAGPLIRLAHRIHKLAQEVDSADAEDDRREWLKARLEEKRHEFDDRDELPSLQEEWLPKSQLRRIVRRTHL